MWSHRIVFLVGLTIVTANPVFRQIGLSEDIGVATQNNTQDVDAVVATSVESKPTEENIEASEAEMNTNENQVIQENIENQEGNEGESESDIAVEIQQSTTQNEMIIEASEADSGNDEIQDVSENLESESGNETETKPVIATIEALEAENEKGENQEQSDINADKIQVLQETVENEVGSEIIVEPVVGLENQKSEEQSEHIMEPSVEEPESSNNNGEEELHNEQVDQQTEQIEQISEQIEQISEASLAEDVKPILESETISQIPVEETQSELSMEASEIETQTVLNNVNVDQTPIDNSEIDVLPSNPQQTKEAEEEVTTTLPIEAAEEVSPVTVESNQEELKFNEENEFLVESVQDTTEEVLAVEAVEQQTEVSYEVNEEQTEIPIEANEAITEAPISDDQEETEISNNNFENNELPVKSDENQINVSETTEVLPEGDVENKGEVPVEAVEAVEATEETTEYPTEVNESEIDISNVQLNVQFDGIHNDAVVIEIDDEDSTQSDGLIEANQEKIESQREEFSEVTTVAEETEVEAAESFTEATEISTDEIIEAIETATEAEVLENAESELNQVIKSELDQETITETEIEAAEAVTEEVIESNEAVTTSAIEASEIVTEANIEASEYVTDADIEANEAVTSVSEDLDIEASEALTESEMEIEAVTKVAEFINENSETVTEADIEAAQAITESENKDGVEINDNIETFTEEQFEAAEAITEEYIDTSDSVQEIKVEPSETNTDTPNYPAETDIEINSKNEETAITEASEALQENVEVTELSNIAEAIISTNTQESTQNKDHVGSIMVSVNGNEYTEIKETSQMPEKENPTEASVVIKETENLKNDDQQKEEEDSDDVEKEFEKVAEKYGLKSHAKKNPLQVKSQVTQNELRRKRSFADRVARYVGSFFN